MSEHLVTQNEVGLATNGGSLVGERGEEGLEVKLNICSVNTA